MNRTATFAKLCKTVQEFHKYRNYSDKVRHLTDYFQCLNNTEDLDLAVRFLLERAYSSHSGKQSSTSSYTISTAAAKFCDIDYKLVFKPCRKAVGDTPETIRMLLDNIEESYKKREPQEQTLNDIMNLIDDLNQVKSRSDKHQILARAWKKMLPVEIKYFSQLLLKTPLLGIQETKIVLSAIAAAYKIENDKVRFIHMITGSSGKTAVLAMENRLNEATFRMFHPKPFMLSSPLVDFKFEDSDKYVAEAELDGLRSQIHIDKNFVKIFSQDRTDITSFFPEVVRYFENKHLPPVILDGVLCVYQNKCIHPSQLLRKRLNHKKTEKITVNNNPALFISFDLLFIDNKILFGEELIKRRQLLEKLANNYGLAITKQHTFSSQQNLIKLFNRFVSHGDKGLIIKKRNSIYEYSERRNSWLRMKSSKKTMNVVIMYAHRSNHRQSVKFPEFTAGISVKDDHRYQEDFIPIGKVLNNLPDDDIGPFNNQINELIVERYGPTLGLIPSLVAEIKYDHIQVNKRTKAGYKLHSSQLSRIRWNLTPDDASTLTDIERMYREEINQNQYNQDDHPSFSFGSPEKEMNINSIN